MIMRKKEKLLSSIKQGFACLLRFMIIILAILGVASCKGKNKDNNTATSPIEQVPYSPSTPPSIISEGEAQFRYMLNHYWDAFPFADTTMINREGYLEQAFANYAYLLADADSVSKAKGVHALMDKAWKAGRAAFNRVNNIAETYLSNPNSPMRNEDSYIAFLIDICNREQLTDTDKLRPTELLRMTMKNRPGMTAANFAYITDKGQRGTLHTIKATHTILFFNNPGCEECERIKTLIAKQACFSQSNGVAIAAIYLDKDTEAWKSTTYPSAWINAHTAEIDKRELYDLKAIPTLYLLDAQKRVILKDATIEQIGTYLERIKK